MAFLVYLLCLLNSVSQCVLPTFYCSKFWEHAGVFCQQSRVISVLGGTVKSKHGHHVILYIYCHAVVRPLHVLHLDDVKVKTQEVQVHDQNIYIHEICIRI